MRWGFFVLILMLGLGGCADAFAQKTTRGKLKLKEEFVVQEATNVDTLWSDSAQVKLNGYEKTLRSNVESIFITNNCGVYLKTISLNVEYLDMQDHSLHKRTVEIEALVPPGETRMLRFPSWDKQKVWYYYLSDPTRTKAQATPYKVKVHLAFAIMNNE